MTLQIYAGLTSQTVRFFVQDTSSTSGAGLTGLTSGSSGLTAYYTKGGTGSATAITLASQTATGAWTSGGFCAVDGTNMPGVYRLDIPNAALDSEVETIVMLRGATNMAPVCLRVTGRVLASDGVKWGGVAVTGMPMPTYTQPTGFLGATFPAILASPTNITAATGIVLSPVTHTGARIPFVTLVDTTTVNSDMRGTDGALLASSYAAPLNTAGTAAAVWNALLATYTTSGSFGARVMRLDAASSGNEAKVTGAGHVASDLHELQPGVITAADFSPNWLTAAGTAADYITELQVALGTAANQTAIKSVTDKLNTGLVLVGAVYQFTANMLELAPGGGGGGSATLANQELILANLDDITGAVSAAVARLQLETQITGFPATICRGSDYDTTLESEIRLQLLDLNNAPITEIGGTPVAEITWLFGLGTDRQPRLVEGACSWDDTTDELVIELAATDTNTTPLGSVTWQIGAQIGELVRWLGGGTTRIVERQFTV